MATEVQVKGTPYTRRELLAALARAWRVVVGGEIPRFALALLCGQVTIETGWDGRYCWNHNVSNIMGTSPEGLFHVLHKAPECSHNPHAIPGATVLETSNVVCAPGQSAYLPAGGSKFRAYTSLDRACVDKLEVQLEIWPKAILALAGATSLDAVTGFVAGLLVDGVGNRRLYMTADPVKYRADVKDIAGTFIKTTSLEDWNIPEEDPDTIPDGVAAKTQSSQRIKAMKTPIDPGTGPDDWRPQTSVTGFLDSLVEKDKS